MNFSRGFKWFVLPLLVLTLGLKWAGSSVTRSNMDSDEKLAERRVSEFLTRNYFKVTGSKEVVLGLQVLVAAATPNCELKVAFSSSRGWHRDFIREMAAGSARTFVVFRGRIYHQQPMWLTVPDFLWARLLQGLGFHAQPTPVITVMAGPNCDAERLPWTKLTWGTTDNKQR